jgi:hypothetical protein
MTMTGPDGAVTRSEPFPRLALTHALSTAGDALITMALAGSLFFSISPTAARGRVTLSLILTMAPFAVVAPFLGPAIDRTRRGRRLLVTASSIGRAIACLAMARVLHGLLLFPAAFASLVLSKGYAVAKSSLVPSAVDAPEDLVEANAKLAVTAGVAGLAAAVPGVALLRFADAVWVLRLAAVLFVAAAIASFRLIERERAAEPGGALEVAARESGTGAVTAAAAVMALLRADVGFLTFLVAFDFRRSGAPAWWFGVVLAASLVAGLGGAGLAPWLRNRLREERMLSLCLGLVTIAAVGATQMHGRLAAVVVAAMVGIAAAIGKLSFDSLVQRDAPDAVRGRAFAKFEAGFQLVWVAGALLPVVIATPLRQGFIVMAIGAAAALPAYILVSRRRA